MNDHRNRADRRTPPPADVAPPSGVHAMARSSRRTASSTSSAPAVTRTSPCWPRSSEVGIEFVIARHEQAAAHAADGYARVSGKVGRACWSTSAPA